MSDYVLYAPLLKRYLWVANGIASLTPMSSHATRYTTKKQAKAALASTLMLETQKLFEVYDIKDVKKSSNFARNNHAREKGSVRSPS